MALVGFTQITTAQINTQYTTANDIGLGTIGADRRGNLFAWVLNGAANLTNGKVVNAPAKVANDTNRSLAAISNVIAGSRVVTVSGGGTVAAAAYAGGYLEVVDGTGKGQTLLISGNTPDYVSGTDTHAVDVSVLDGVNIALAIADTKVSLVTNPYANVVVTAGDSASYLAVGVPEIAVTAANYSWVKIRGMTSVLSDGVIAKAVGAILSASVSGAVVTEASGTLTQRIGTAVEATVDTKYYPIFLSIV